MCRGFTLIEILIVCSIIVMLAAVSFPFYSVFQKFSATESVAFEIKENLRTAQINARSGQNNTNFGIYFSDGQYVLYQGVNYAIRTTSADQTFTLPANFTVSGATEINFQHSTGLPTFSSTITITNTGTQTQSTIFINSLGLIY